MIDKRLPLPPVRNLGDLDDRLRQYCLTVGEKPESEDLDLGGVSACFLCGPVGGRKGMYSINIGFTLHTGTLLPMKSIRESTVYILNQKAGWTTTARFFVSRDGRFSLNITVPYAGEYIFSVQPE